MFEPYQEAEMAALGCLEKARAMVASGSKPEAAFIACRKAARAAAKAPVRAADAAEAARSK
ncbi:MAG: hypothetical protein IT374_26390 [Polyangiaceae bacterium]|nr:hypothetical protein [Polyangiaceae bacterium]